MIKTLIKFTGLTLIGEGIFVIFLLILETMAAASPGETIENWGSVLKLCVPLFIVSGITLFSFKEWARKLALVSIAVGFAHLIFYFYINYGVLFKPHNLNSLIILLANMFICLSALCLLFFSKKQFQSRREY